MHWKLKCKELLSELKNNTKWSKSRQIKWNTTKWKCLSVEIAASSSVPGCTCFLFSWRFKSWSLTFGWLLIASFHARTKTLSQRAPSVPWLLICCCCFHSSLMLFSRSGSVNGDWSLWSAGFNDNEKQIPFPIVVKTERERCFLLASSGSRVRDQESGIRIKYQDQGLRIKDEGSGIEDQEPSIRNKDPGSRIQDQGSRTKNQGSRI